MSRQSIAVQVDYSAFALQEEDDTQVPVMYPEGRVRLGTSLLVSHSMRVDVESAGHTHEALLAVEVWSGEPPIDESEAWEERGEARITSPTGQLAVWVIAGPQEERIALGCAQATWRLRMYSAGREEVARLTDVEVPQGVERYLAHFWQTG
ncbi:hypothetical protein [Streptomyces buecherae]|uniref:Uncharacterized protein n=1 Tax=Streptomyces buecherae TaxID=2763006 RepID=A0A7H8N2N6_9ACTN|nr:hypothetical protein [Streptomyces buecherae]QKW48690.1 hypothetical protein HUT08_03060 [Streptomyces buecherae]